MLANRRMLNLSNNYYNKLWNLTQTVCNRTGFNDYIVKELEKCIILSEIVKDGDWIAFFQDKIAAFKD